MVILGPADSGSGPVWAQEVSQRLLEPLGTRWSHTEGVATCARLVGAVLEPGDADVLLAAAYLHDVGYAPELVETGFHCVDGARFVRSCGHERLAGLVAYHSGAAVEARERGLGSELAEFNDERSLVSQALTYCDLTTDATGQPVPPLERLAEIRRRYGPSAAETHALDRSEPTVMSNVRTIAALLAARGIDDRARQLRDVRSRG